jgi:hypothetical protein
MNFVVRTSLMPAVRSSPSCSGESMANAPLFQREGDGGVNNGLDISSRHGTVPLAVASVLLRRRRLDSLLRIQKRKEKEMCVAFLTHHPTPWLQMFLSGSHLGQGSPQQRPPAKAGAKALIRFMQRTLALPIRTVSAFIIRDF